MTRAFLVADYENIRYLCLITPDKAVYTLAADIAADLCIPQYPVPIHLTIMAETDETSIVKKCAIRKDNLITPLLTEERCVTHFDNIGFHIEYHYDNYVEIYLENEESMHFGRHPNNQVVLANCFDNFTFVLINTEKGWELHPFPNIEGVYINRALCGKERPTLLQQGDIIHFAGYILEMQEISCTLYHQQAYIGFNDLTFYRSPPEPDTHYPYFKRPPRKQYPLPAEKVTIPSPPGSPGQDRNSLILILAPMLAIMVLMVVMASVLGRGIYILISAGTMSVTAVVTGIRFFRDRKKKKEDEAERVSFYNNLLNQKRKEIRALIHKQRQGLELAYPPPSDSVRIAEGFSPRLFERISEHKDFLHIRIGTSSQPLSFIVEHRAQETKEAAKDPLALEAAALAGQYNLIPSLPQSISLYDAYVGIVGFPELTIPHTLALITSLFVFHSHNDLTLIVVYDKDHEQDFLPLKWLPHTWIGERQFKGMVKDEATRDNVVDSLLHHIRERASQYKDSSSGNPRFMPLLFLVVHTRLLDDHPVMDYLSKDHRHLGIYAIFAVESEYTLPESVKILLKLKSADEATLFREKDLRPRPYIPDFINRDTLLRATRSLAPIQHTEKSSSNALPESVTLFELLQIETPEELNILEKWHQNKPYQTLAVPIGLRAADKIIELNLHEKAHGPHGLLAGTTGSGKSETLQSYIVSLAVHFHPHEVAFLLVDYKGGGMANLFEKLPHLLGTITNLDGVQSMRALIAIKSELRRRQRVLGLHNVNHVDSYQKLCAKDPSLEPMPHLFIISDEFAELKREQPEFIRELVSAARIGRSLGVHLILATQKPSGVVDDQIWSNSNFRICLKVQNPSDSNEMLKTPDAANIKLPGRGYLQVGNNLIYELFQSAYSGAACQADEEISQETIDNNIYRWNDLGQAQLLTQNFSTLPLDEDDKTMPITQLDVTIDAIEATFAATGLPKVPSPWLPPLSEIIYLPDLLAWHRPESNGSAPLAPKWADSTAVEGEDIEIAVGIVDEIEYQRQVPLTINFTVDGHVAAIGSSSSGKSTFLHTIALSLAQCYSPAHVSFLILDFGNNTLLPLQSLPHTADSFTLEDNEKLKKMERFLSKEIKRRKDALGAGRVSSITLLNKISGKSPVPALFIFIDNIDPLREYDNDYNRMDLENLIKNISRDGSALSIYLVFTASRSGAVNHTIFGNVKNKYVFYTIDKSEINSILGRTDLQSESIPGRGLVKTDMICSFQTALPSYGETEKERILEFQHTMDTIYKAWQGPQPKGIPIMPDVLLIGEFYNTPSVIQVLAAPDKNLPVALDNEDIEAFTLNFDTINHLLIVGAHNTGKTNLIKVLVESLARKSLPFTVHILDDAMFKLISCRNRIPNSSYLTEQEEISALIKELSDEVNQRKTTYAQKMKSQETILTPAEFYAGLPPHIIIVSNTAHMITMLAKDEQEAWGILLKESQLTGIHFCFVSNLADFPKGYDTFPNMIKTITTGFSLIPLDQPGHILPTPSRTSQYNHLRLGEAYYLSPGNVTLVKIPKI